MRKCSPLLPTHETGFLFPAPHIARVLETQVGPRCSHNMVQVVGAESVLAVVPHAYWSVLPLPTASSANSLLKISLTFGSAAPPNWTPGAKSYVPSTPTSTSPLFSS
ncbi:hypothetical protein [Absidia glauca]|uniref:Uncharacterized protein n=1 Tax=Absidia glauca TaxID=4829 RepID=A0A163IXK5_ABSGL|nr:hypothetical protein [Absidia glauca]